MKASILHKLEQLSERIDEINALLADAGIIADQNRFRALSQEYAQVNPVATAYREYCKTLGDITEAESMLKDGDADMRAMAEEEMHSANERRERQEKELQLLLLPSDPNDHRNVFMEIRAGTGGDEAALFAGDLLRMLSNLGKGAAK